MIPITSIKEFVETQNEFYRIALSPYEMEIVKSALRNYAFDLADDMNNFEWEATQHNKYKLERTEELAEDLEEVPF